MWNALQDALANDGGHERLAYSFLAFASNSSIPAIRQSEKLFDYHYDRCGSARYRCRAGADQHLARVRQNYANPLESNATMTPEQFIAKWETVELGERAAAQCHFIDRCRRCRSGRLGRLRSRYLNLAPLLTAPPSPCSVGTSQPCRLS